MENHKNQKRTQTDNRFDKGKSHSYIYIRPTSPKEQKRAAFRRRAMIFFALIFSIGALGLAAVGYSMYHDTRQLEQLATLAGKNHLEDSRNTLSSASSPTDIENDSAYGGDTANSNGSDGLSVLSQYELLHQKNADFWGWIQIEDTSVNYPVMHTPLEPEKYLRANFDGEYSYSGLPFLDADCTENSDNLLIYGHNMINGSMFTDLTKYKSKSFWETHPTIKLDTLYQQYEYEVIFAFYDRVYSKNENVFKFYQFHDADSEQDFSDAIADFQSKQLYDTGIDATFGDQLLTLVTCEYHAANGRFVVVARKR